MVEKIVLVAVCVVLGVISTLFLSNKKLDDCPHNEECCACKKEEE